MRRSLSLRLRLTLWYTAVLSVSLSLYALAVYVVLRRHVYAELDLRLHEEVEAAANRVEVSPEGQLAWRGGEGLAPTEEEPGGARWIEVWSRGGRLLLSASSPVVGVEPLPRLETSEREQRLTLTNGLRVRALAKAARVAGRPVVVRVAHSEEAVRQQLRHLLLGLGLVLPLAVVVSGLLGYVLVGKLLSPIARMAERSRRITAERLGERLPVENPEDELGQLATAFNQTFAGLERSFEQLRRFTADASHELRTPLTAIRSVGEVGLAGARDEAGYREVIGSMLEEADRVTRLVDALLTLARADAGEARLTLEEFDLVALAQEVVAHLSVLAEERQQSLSVEAGEALRVRGDHLVLRQALVNLVDNAIKYSPHGSPIRVVARRRDGTAVVEVIDRGPGIPEAHRERVFERFHRVDKSRSRERGGAGLGLSIVKWSVEAHGGRVELETREGGGSTFRVVIPQALTA